MTKTLVVLLALLCLGPGVSMLLRPASRWHFTDQGNRNRGRPWKPTWQWELSRLGTGLFCLVLAGVFGWVAWYL